SSHLPGAGDDIFIGAQLLQPHGSPGVELLGGDAHFAAQTELPAVGEPGGGVPVHRRAVHQGEELPGGGLVIGNDGVGVVGGVGGDMGDGLLHAVHHLDGQDVV